MAENNIRVVNPKSDGYQPDKILDQEVEGQMAVRGVTSPDGRRFVLRQKEETCLWQVVPRRGSVPQMLAGLYTSQRDAEQAIIRYCAQFPSQARPYNVS